MSRRSRILLALVGLIGLGVLAFWPSTWRPPAHANVTLISFTAELLPGQPKVLIKWETATEFSTAGFYVKRSDSAASSFTRVSDFIEPRGDTIVGARYAFTDTNTVVNRTYSYQLEEITTNGQAEFYGPITITTGISGTATSTRTPTLTPTPSATPTTRATSNVEATTSRTGGSYATPQLATGSTVTPRPTAVNVVATNPVPASTPLVFDTATAVPVNVVAPQPVSSIDTPVPAILSGSMANQVTPVPTIMTVAQAPEPTLSSAAFVPAQVAPVVVAEAEPSSPAENSANTTVPLLLIAAVLLLGGGLVILLQARK